MNDRADLIAKAGDWITTKGGKKVCRAAVAIRRNDPVETGQFIEWQEGFSEPRVGQAIPLYEPDPWVRLKPDGLGLQLHVEGKWRP
jgi:hypothetical protein